MTTERRICCCGASTCSKVVAWIQIVTGTISIIASLIYQGILTMEIEAERKIIQIAILVVPSFLVIIMGVILLIGTNQKRVGYLRAWIVYESVVIACAILFSMLLVENVFYFNVKIFVDIIYVVAMALHAFALTVVYIHMKDINEEVSDLHPNEPVTTALERKICGGIASSWTPVISWILIVYTMVYPILAAIHIYTRIAGVFVGYVYVANTINLIASIIFFYRDIWYRGYMASAFIDIVFSVAGIIFYVLGIIMAIILLRGTNQKRVGFLRVWLIYGGVAIASTILAIFRISLFLSLHEYIRGYTILSAEMALNVFALLVVYIHKNEIDEGVFSLHRKQPVTRALERTTWCVEASLWTPFIAWIQIIANTSNLIGSICIAVFVYSENVLVLLLVISNLFSILGIIMAIILRQGTNQKRVCYLRAYIIYGGAAVAVSVLMIIATAIVIRVILYHVVLEVAFNIFSLVVIHIHIKEINEGVFDLPRREPLTMAEPHGETIYLQ